MSEQHRILHKNQWISLLEVQAPEIGCNGYVYAQYTRAGDHVVSLLPYRVVRNPGGPFDSSARIEYLLRSEITPAWHMNHELSAITGGWEGHEDFAIDAARELAEEGGYKINPRDLIPLGRSLGTKFTSTRYVLFSADLTGKEQGAIVGDGSAMEASGTAVWVPAEKLADVQDPHVAVMYLRLSKMLWEQ
jgi:8-oxo-dGTP pyrophosphatase MutT (NUDIX family)